MTVYWDIMFMMNFMVDYIILYSTSKAIFLNANFYKMALGALIGGIYGVFAFEESALFSVITYFLVTLLVIYISFSKINIKTILTFYLISFIFGGISACLNNMYGVVKVSGGFFYIENNLLVILAGVLLSSLFVVLSLKLINRKNLINNNKQLFEIFMNGKSVKVTGIIDTGNFLLDPITQYPVVLVSFDSIKEIIPKELDNFLKEGKDISGNINRSLINKIRLIPCKNSHSDDILKGFKPDCIQIDKKVIKDVIIAVTYKKLSDNNEFDAILNPQI